MGDSLLCWTQLGIGFQSTSLQMNGFLSIKGKLEKPSSSVQSFFNGEEETVPEKLRRQEIANDLRYEFESAVHWHIYICYSIDG